MKSPATMTGSGTAALASYWGRAAVPLPVIVAGDFNTLSYKHWDPRIAPPDAFEQLTSPKPSAKKLSLIHI